MIGSEKGIGRFYDQGMGLWDNINREENYRFRGETAEERSYDSQVDGGCLEVIKVLTRHDTKIL